MVELDRGLFRAELSALFVPERKQITHEGLAGMFGANYRQLIEDKATQLGINERLRFRDSPKPHDGSQALYIVEQFIDDDWVLVSVLGSNMETSKHHHEAPMIKEKYLHIAGESFVAVGSNVIALNEKNNSIEVPLDINHQVTTKENPALTLIVMENARLVPSGRLHIKDIQ